MKTALAFLALLLLGACNAEERAHVVKLDKGGYAGAADSAISEATRQALRHRVLAQAGGAVGVAPAMGIADMPSGEAAPTGRILGQSY